MRVNTAKRRMLEGKPAIGTEVGLGSPLAAELISPLGYEFIVVDTQHGAWWEESTMHAFRSIGLGDSIPMARVRQNDFGAIGRLLDQGAMGIIVPMVSTVEQAEAAAFAVRYPPRGGRSGGAFGAGFHGEDYNNQINDEVFLAVQIETDQARESAEQIMAVEGVDGCWIGPHDLALSMGLDLNTPEGQEAHTAAIQSVLDACTRTNKISGISTQTVAMARKWLDRGGLFVTVAGDTEWVLSGAKETLRQIGRPA